MSLAVTVSPEAHWPSLSAKTGAAGSLFRAYGMGQPLNPINPVKAKDVNGSCCGIATCRVAINTHHGLQCDSQY
jgi:hypothetical protein